MRRVQLLFYLILSLGLVAMWSLQLPPPRHDPCAGLRMADCGVLR